MKTCARALLFCFASTLTLSLTACSGGDDPPPPPPVVKHLYFSQDSNANGLFEIDMVTGVATVVGSGISGTTASTAGLTETGDPSVLLASRPFGLGYIAADGSGATPTIGSLGIEGLAMNLDTGVLYAGINGAFFTVHPMTGAQLATLAAPGADLEGLAATGDSVYGIGGNNSNLFRYTVSTDTWATVGDTGVAWDNAGLAWDPHAGVLWAVDQNNDSLYSINPATAAATLIGPLGIPGGGGLALVVE